MKLSDYIQEFDDSYVFRYRSLEYESTIEAIEKNNLYFSRVIDFNDLFDGMVSVDFQRLYAAKVENVSLGMQEYIDSHHKRNPQLMMWMDAVWNLKDRDEVIQMYLEDTFDRVMEIRENIQWSVKAICFSKTAYSVPMWAHYANEHRGIVLAYKRDKLIHAPLYDELGNLSPRDVLIKDINYSDARVDVTEEMHTYCNKGFQVFEEENDNIPELSHGKIRQSVLTKSKEWS